MAGNFLKGCVEKYKGGVLKLPLDPHMLMPWVEVWLTGDEDKKIAVANTTSEKNKAAVKSFQFGMSDGMGVEIEIVDEEGGNFSKFFKKISTGNKEAKDKFLLNFKWGWAKIDCDGNKQTFGEDARDNPNGNPPVPMESKTHHMLIHTIICDVSNGFFKFKIEGTDMAADMQRSRTDHAIGEDGKPVPVVQAIKELLNKFGVTAKFKTMDADGVVRDSINWLKESPDGGKDGPKARFNGLNRNPIQAARDWINIVITDKKKGVVIFWDTTATKPTIVFMESTRPDCKEVFESSPFNVATYIVNGGAGSPVISFTPQLGFDYAQVVFHTGGIAGDAVAAKMAKIENGPNPCWTDDQKKHVDHAGIEIVQAEWHALRRIFQRDANIKGNENKLVHSHHNLNAKAIDAELRIQGDPSYDNPVMCTASFVSVVFINPFNITGSGGDCEWVHDPICNDILSNMNWMIKGVFHEIRDGSYTTTLKLSLPAPGIDIPRPAPLGGMAGAPKIDNK
jgi:hypothetical protein